MDLLWLKSFVAVVRHQSFTRAARELHMTQPAVSRHVQKLEQAIGASLLDRTTAKIATTPAGERVLEFAEDTIQRIDRLTSEFGTSIRQIAGRLNVAASTTPGEFLVPTLLSWFTRAFPEVEPHVRIFDSTTVTEEVLAGRWDVGFVGARFPGRRLTYVPVADDEVLLAIPPGHEFFKRDVIALEELEGQTFLQREDGSGTLISVRTALARKELQMPDHRLAMILGSTDAIVTAVEHGHGLGWVSSLALENRSSERVGFVRVAELDLNRTLFMAHLPLAELNDVTREFVSWVRANERS